MSQLREKDPEEKNLGFKWGIEKGVGGKNGHFTFYESFFYKGEEYFVYDCVYFQLEQPESFIGKLVKLFEGPNHVKKVKVVWFMRPSEIRNYLGDYEPLWNEIFLASGQGRGVSNINLVYSITGKCNVVCTSNDRRNPQVSSEADLRRADYFFRCRFDVGELAILDTFPDMVDGVKVEHFFNKKKERKPIGPNNLESNVKGQTQRPNLKESKVMPVIMRKQVQAQDELDKAVVKLPKDSPISSTEVRHYKKRFQDGQLGQDRNTNIDNQLVQVSRKPVDDRRNWFKQLPWEQRLEKAQEAGSLVSLENVNPSFTSEEVEDLVWNALEEKVEAKMIEQTAFSCPCYGKALVIFKTKEAAQSAIGQLMRRCLMLADGRPLIARKGFLRKPGKSAGFVGHHTIDRLQLQRQTEERRKAKSTSHASQPNNIEFDLGMEWRLLQQKSDMWWKALHEQQAKEIQAVRNQLKMKCQ